MLEAGDDEWYRNEIPDDDFAKLVTSSLRWMQACSSGVSHILGTGLLTDDVILTNAAGVHADALGREHAGGCPAACQTAPQEDREPANSYLGRGALRRIAWRTMTVLGTGNIGYVGRSTGQRLPDEADRGPSQSATDASTLELSSVRMNYTTVLPETDYLVIACPLTDETHGMIGALEFAIRSRKAPT